MSLRISSGNGWTKLTSFNAGEECKLTTKKMTLKATIKWRRHLTLNTLAAVKSCLTKVWMGEHSLFVSGFNTRGTKIKASCSKVQGVQFHYSFITTWIQKTLIKRGLWKRSTWRQPGLVQTCVRFDRFSLACKSIPSGLPAMFPCSEGEGNSTFVKINI